MLGGVRQVRTDMSTQLTTQSTSPIRADRALGLWCSCCRTASEQQLVRPIGAVGAAEGPIAQGAMARAALLGAGAGALTDSAGRWESSCRCNGWREIRSAWPGRGCWVSRRITSECEVGSVIASAAGDGIGAWWGAGLATGAAARRR